MDDALENEPKHNHVSLRVACNTIETDQEKTNDSRQMMIKEVTRCVDHSYTAENIHQRDHSVRAAACVSVGMSRKMIFEWK